MSDADDLREALAEEHPDWHPEVQRLVQAHVLKLEAALRAFQRNDPAALSLARAALAGDRATIQPTWKSLTREQTGDEGS